MNVAMKPDCSKGVVESIWMVLLYVLQFTNGW